MIDSRAPKFALVVLQAATLVVLSPWLGGDIPAYASAGTSVESPPAGQAWESVQVTGTGEVFGEPDTLFADFAVETSASTVDGASTSANAAATRMRDALVRAGISTVDIQTSNIVIGSRLDDDQEITSYTAGQGLTATIRNLPQSGAILSTAIAAGGDAARLKGTSFAIEDQVELLNDARKKAFANARETAELYARQAGRPLGRVVKVSEATRYQGRTAEYNTATGSTVPIEPGRQRLTVSVTVEWSFQSVSRTKVSCCDLVD